MAFKGVRLTLWDHFLKCADRTAEKALRDIHSRADWEAQRSMLLGQFMQSVGLDPLPERCDLRLTKVGELSGEGYSVRRIAFQILPDCWASACLFLPEQSTEALLPAVLYVCGHKEIGVLGYQDHAVMWAKRGYVCLILDSIEQHDNPADHHGLYYGRRHDWLSLGYTAAGGELWNSIRALDVLVSLPQVDVQRIGVTGISGGGALSFYLAIADQRVAAVASACGVAVPKWTIENRHLLGHCDCMYFHNPYQRDCSEFGALIAPRPTLLAYAYEDSLFSRREYRHIARQMARVYGLYQQEKNFSLFEYPGPHGYTPAAVKVINDWFDQHVARGQQPEGSLEAPVHAGTELSVFAGRSFSDRLRLLPELLSAQGSLKLPRSPAEWPPIREEAVEALKSSVFERAPRSHEQLEVQQLGNWIWSDRRHLRYKGNVDGMEIWIEVLLGCRDQRAAIVGVADGSASASDVFGELRPFADSCDLVAIEPRGTGFSAMHAGHEHELLRAGALVGLTPVMIMMRDIGLVLEFLRDTLLSYETEIWLYGRGNAGVACLYQAVIDERLSGLVAQSLPSTHRQAAPILGILRVLDIDQALGLLAPRPVCLIEPEPNRNTWARRAYQRMGCPERLVTHIRSLDAAVPWVLQGTS